MFIGYFWCGGSFVSNDGEKSLVWFIALSVFIPVCSLSLLNLCFTSTPLAVLLFFPIAKKARMCVLTCGVLFHLLVTFLFCCGGLVAKT